MARSEHKRQKQLAKKQKRTIQVRKQQNRDRNLSDVELLLRIAQVPISYVFTHRGETLGSVTVAKQTASHGLVCVGFLVDTLGLGVKDCFMTRFVDNEFLSDMRGRSKPVKPEWALKWILGAMDFAQQHGMPASRKARELLEVFHGVDAADCHEEFEYGIDGKPHLIFGPNDSQLLLSMLSSDFRNISVDSSRDDDLDSEEGDPELESGPVAPRILERRDL